LFVLGLEFGIIFFYCKAILFDLGLEFGKEYQTLALKQTR
jgi:hypothetical protein